MRVRTTAVLLVLQLSAGVAFAQDGRFQRWPTRERQGSSAPAPAPNRGDGDTRARERGPQREAQAEGDNRRDNRTRARERANAPAPELQRDQDRDNRPRNNSAVIRRNDDRGRVAVPRQGPPPRVVRPNGRSDRNIYLYRPPVYYYTPRFERPYVYGSRGPGYFYYGSFGWYPRATYYYDGSYFGRGFGYDTGEIRLRVEPRWAEIWVDGYFAGTVDDFDGTFQSLRLESGPYHIEIVAPGYETLEVDLLVTPGRKITYRAQLRPEF